MTPDRPEAAPILDLDLKSLSLGGKPVLRDIRLQVPRLETLALVGPSGVGKTSLLRVIAGLTPDFDGRCVLNGRCAVVFQEPRLLPWLDAERNICAVTGVSPETARATLAAVGLSGLERTLPDQLSLGQQRRVALARAFATRPDLLLLDEPFVSLDAALAARMMDLFARTRRDQGLTTILVTHAADEARRLASRIVTLGGAPAGITSDVPNERARTG